MYDLHKYFLRNSQMMRDTPSIKTSVSSSSLAAFVANYGAFPFPSSSFLVASFVAVDGGDGGIWIDEFSPAHPTSGVDLREGSVVRDTTEKFSLYLS